jgi:hypothetical protein
MHTNIHTYIHTQDDGPLPLVRSPGSQFVSEAYIHNVYTNINIQLMNVRLHTHTHTHTYIHTYIHTQDDVPLPLVRSPGS